MASCITDDGYWRSMLNQSLCKFFILRALYEEPLHGYGVIKAVEEQTGGFCVPTEGSVYPILREFKDCACAESSEETHNGRRRKVYRLTAKGRRTFERGTEVWEEGLRQVQAASAVCAA
jgi:DNA-binding PadR family transcriptional regulator